MEFLPKIFDPTLKDKIDPGSWEILTERNKVLPLPSELGPLGDITLINIV